MKGLVVKEQAIHLTFANAQSSSAEWIMSAFCLEIFCMCSTPDMHSVQKASC